MDENLLIFDKKFSDKEKIIYFKFLITQAYKINPNFKKMDELEVKNNMNSIIKQMHNKYYKSSPKCIISIISHMRLWTRNNLPKSFKFDDEFNYMIHKKRYDFIKNMNLNALSA